MKQTLLLATTALGLLASSCKKSSNTTQTQPSVNYQIAVVNTNYAVAKTTAVANVQWTSAVAYPDVVKFEATQDNLQVTFTSTNKEQIDLMAPVALTFGNFVLPAGFYNNISLKIDLDKNGNAPVLLLNGQFTHGAFSVPVTLSITQSVELTTDQQDVLISNDNAYTAVTTIDLSALTSGITADMLLNAQLTGGTIVISASSNRDMYEMVVEHLEHETHHCEFEHHHH